MSGGKEKAKTNKMIDQDRAIQQQQLQQQQQTYQPRETTAYNQNQGAYNDIYGGYKDIASGKFKTPGAYSGAPPLPGSIDDTGHVMGGENVPGGEKTSAGGGYGGAFQAIPTYSGPDFNTGMYGDVQNAYRASMGKEGGLAADRIANMDTQLGGMGTIGKYGASSAEDAARLKGGGVYENLAATGGYTPEQIIQMRNQSTAPIGAMYSNMKGQLNRNAMISGGSPNQAAAIAQMARTGAQGIGQTATQANLGIQDQIRQGKLAGAQGLTSTQQNIVNNQMGGLGAAFAGQQGLAESIRGGQQWGTQGLQSVAQAQEQARQAAAASAASAASAANADQKWRYGMGVDEARYKYGIGADEANQYNQNVAGGLAGMGGMYGQNTSMEQYYGGMGQNANQAYNQAQGQNYGARIQNNPYTPPWKIGTTIANTASNFFMPH